ncbi:MULTISPECIES: hypothetical protein [unclassified Campylobacter]|uniref:hypothetical protein n=1 Tax=unclassified Campylobacter TaxID=2593542 RepID=UPI001CC1FB73|nr:MULTISPECIES: hypothetical protein [unclassified Campylobacter]
MVYNIWVIKLQSQKKLINLLEKLAKNNPKQFKVIDKFIFIQLRSEEEYPCTLPNAKDLKSFDDNRYRWRLDDYRIIGIVQNNEFKIIHIIKISKRDESTYKGL